MVLSNRMPSEILARRAVDPPLHTAGGWREGKADGGVVVDVARNEVVMRGLSMPHSPRWLDGRLWVLSSGVGEVWAVDVQTGTHDVVVIKPKAPARPRGR